MDAENKFGIASDNINTDLVAEHQEQQQQSQQQQGNTVMSAERKLMAENKLLLSLIKDMKSLFNTRVKQADDHYKRKYEKEFNERMMKRKKKAKKSQPSDNDEEKVEDADVDDDEEEEEMASSMKVIELEEKVAMLEAEKEKLLAKIRQLENTTAGASYGGHGNTSPYVSLHSNTQLDSSHLSGEFSTGDGFHPESMSLKELKQFITSKGFRHDDCLEKEDLIARAREAALSTGGSFRRSGGLERNSGLSRRIIMQQLRTPRGFGSSAHISLNQPGEGSPTAGVRKTSLDSPGMSAENLEAQYQEIVPTYNAPQQGIYLDGWLMKSPALSAGTGLAYSSSTSLLSKKRRRWFILTNRSLLYFKSPTSLMPLGVIELLHAIIQPGGIPGKKKPAEGAADFVAEPPTSFVVKTPHMDYVLAAEDADQCKKWMDTTSSCVDALTEQYYFEKQKFAGAGASFRMRAGPDGVVRIPGEVEAIIASKKMAAAAATSPGGDQNQSINLDSSITSAGSSGSTTGAPASTMTCYEWLGVTPSATVEEIKDAFDELEKTNNPKSNPGKDMEYHMIRYSWNILGNPFLRRRYDLSQKVLVLFRAGFVCVEHILPGTVAHTYAVKLEEEQIKQFNREWDEYGRRPKKSLRTKEWSRSDIERKMMFYSDYNLDRVFWQPALKWDSPRGYLLLDSVEVRFISQVFTANEAQRNQIKVESLAKLPEDTLDRILIIELEKERVGGTPIILGNMFILEFENEADCSDVALGLRVYLAEKYNKSIYLKDEQ